jgi:hypothetical protein
MVVVVAVSDVSEWHRSSLGDALHRVELGIPKSALTD